MRADGLVVDDTRLSNQQDGGLITVTAPARGSGFGWPSAGDFEPTNIEPEIEVRACGYCGLIVMMPT